MTAAVASADSPFAYADKIFPDSYFGDNAASDHHLSAFAEGDSPSFKDLVDIINPLQHIPVVSAIYREVTGDQPGAAARLIGGALYGGPIGLVGEEINCAINDSTGHDLGGHVIAYLKRQFSDDPSPESAPPTELAAPAAAPAPVAIAAAEPPLPAAAPVAAVTSEAVTAAVATPVAPAPAVAATAAPSAPVTLAQADTSARFMPLPQRRAIDVAPMPLVRTPLSNTSQRSNVPITGRSTTAATASAASVQQAIAAQGTSPSAASVAASLSGTTQAANGTTAPTPTPQAQWFSSAMTQALDKYERAGRLNKADPQASMVQ